MAKRTIQHIQYSPEKIKISFVTEPKSVDSVWDSSSALQAPIENKKTATGSNNEFVTADCAPMTVQTQTFTLAIPNAVHGLKTLGFRKRKRKH